MDSKNLKNHDDVLEAIADAIDIPDHMDQRARDRYHSLGDWLDRKASTIAHLAPEVSPQGSFLLGTVIRPLGDFDEYDVDIVCTLKDTKTNTSMKQLKVAVGREIKSYAAANNMKNDPEDGRRCWTLEYSDEAQFHMDVLPAIPDVEGYRATLTEYRALVLLNEAKILENAVAITDNTLPQYPTVSNDWPISNPKGFAVWFASRQADVLDARKQRLVEQELFASVDDVPNYKVKTPLQRSIQLLKRHRDSMFEGADDKPISIIITTLAAHAYGGENTVSQALRTILRGMRGFIEERDGIKWVQNPVNPHENFADKWPETPQKEKNFFTWLDQAQKDFGSYLASPFGSVPTALQERFSDRTFEKISPLIALAAPAAVAASDAVCAEAEDIKTSGTTTKPWAK